MLIVHDDGPVRTLTLHRPACLNALDLEHLGQLRARVTEASEDREIRVLVLAGTDRAFSVGSDIREMATMTAEDFAKATRCYQALARTFWSMQMPTVAALRGHVIGGGLELALMCDLRVAAPSARLALPDLELGFSPSGGLTYHLPRLIGHGWTSHLLLTGEAVPAEKALALGLVTRVVDEDQLTHEVEQLSRRLARYPRAGVTGTLELLRRDTETFESCLAEEEQRDRASFNDPRTQEALQAFLTARTRRRQG